MHTGKKSSFEGVLNIYIYVCVYKYIYVCVCVYMCVYVCVCVPNTIEWTMNTLS